MSPSSFNSFLQLMVRTCALLVVLLATTLTAAEGDAVGQIEPLLRAVQERYHTVTGRYVLLPANKDQARPFTFENEALGTIKAGGNPFPPDGFYNGISEAQQLAMTSDIISQCAFVVSQFKEGATPDSPFLSMPEVKNLPLDQALRTATEALRGCRYVHFGPGGHQVLPVQGTLRRIDILRNSLNPPLDAEWFNAGFVRTGSQIYDKTRLISDDNVYAFSQRTRGELAIGLNGAGGNTYTTIGTGFEYGFRLTYDLSAWSGTTIRPYYSVTWYSGLGNSAQGAPIWPSASGKPAIAPPEWPLSGITTSVLPPLSPWMTNLSKQQGDILESGLFPASSTVACGKTTEITLGMDYDRSSLSDVGAVDSIHAAGYFYQIDYRGFMIDLAGRFANPIPVQEPIVPAAIYPGSCPTCVGVVAKDFSLIDNGSMTYYHDAWDYKVGAVSGCGTCGGATAAGAASVELSLGRVHRYRDLDWGASFGPGVLCNHDLRLQLFADGSGGTVARFFDPLQRVVCELTAATADATFVDPTVVALTLTLHTGAGTSVTNLADARTAVLALKDGRTLNFELFPPAVRRCHRARRTRSRGRGRAQQSPRLCLCRR